MSERPPSIYIEDAEALAGALPALAAAPVIAVDSESDSLYRYRERVCFLQLGVDRRAFLIDTLALKDLSPLAPIFANPDQVKIFHGADYDISCLSRDFGMRFENIFDTMIAAQYIGREHLGLAALVREFFNVELDKTLTRHDWGLRPLGVEYLEYLAGDVIYLTEIRANLEREMAVHDVAEEAALECMRLSRLVGERAPPDPEAFRRIKGSRELDHEGLSVLRELHALREHLASEADRPPFKVVGNQQLLDVSALRPRALDQLARIHGFTDRLVHRMGRAVLKCVDDGLRRKDELVFRPKPTAPRAPDEQLACNEALRTWRRIASERDNRTTVAILPNHLIATISERRPTTLDQLATIPYLGPRRVERYGEAILAITRDPPPLESGHRHRPGRGD